LLDPLEGLTADGMIRTGASPARIAPRFSPVLENTVERIGSIAPKTTVYVYGSVATGRARAPDSDVDLLTIGLLPERAAEISEQMSVEFVDICRRVEIAAATETDFHGDGDRAYGARVFLHHYCVRLAGTDLDRSNSDYRGDRRAARGLNGDIAQHAARWRWDLDSADSAQLSRRAARKALLAVSGLVSVHDKTWTTDREHAARRWQEVHPELSSGLEELLQWSTGRHPATSERLTHRLDTTIDQIVDQFATDVGLWPS
jgi:uncharacterized protein